MMRILQLYNADGYGRVGSRICPLPDCDSAIVRQEVNGEYSLTMSLPNGAKYEDEVKFGLAIKAVVDELGTEQYFVVKRVNRSLTEGIDIYAEHQSYLYNGIIVEPFAGGRTHHSTFLRRLYLNCNPSIESIGSLAFDRASDPNARLRGPDTPRPLRALLHEWLVANLGGELSWDGLNMTWVDAVGQNRGAFFRYGINATAMETEDILDTYASGVYPFWGILGDPNRPLVQIANKIIEFSGSYPVKNIIPLDLTDTAETQPTAETLQTAAEAWIAVNAPGAVPVSVRAARARLEGDTPVLIGDTVRVVNDRWGLDVSLRVMALTFNALSGMVEDVELGTVNPGFPGAVKNTK